MIEFKEPLDKLARMPTTFTKGKHFLSPGKIKIYDDTLRDGEQMPGVAFSPEQKLELAKLLADVGVHVMDVGFPVVSASDRKALQLILQAQRKKEINENVEILAMCRANPKDIDAVVETVKEIGMPAKSVAVLILSTLSDLHLKYKLGRHFLKLEGKPESEWMDSPMEFYREANIKMITSAISYARGKGLEKIEFAAEDASRCDVKYAIRWGKACIKAGGTRFCFSDTVGCFTPEAVDHYFPEIVKITTKKGIELHAHFHNDFGMAAFNCVRALSHGASHPGVTVNAIGERAGNAPLEHVVMILKMLYGVELPGFKYHKLTELRRMVEKFTGIPLQPHYPITGEGVFSHESGIHTAAIVIHPAIYQFIPEEMVGGRRRFIFGKHTGTAAVEDVLRKNTDRLKKTGVVVTPELIQKLTEKVKELREAAINDGHAEQIVKAYYENYNRLGISEEQLVRLAETTK